LRCNEPTEEDDWRAHRLRYGMKGDRMARDCIAGVQLSSDFGYAVSCSAVLFRCEWSERMSGLRELHTLSTPSWVLEELLADKPQI